MKRTALALLCAALPCAALAEEPRYTYIEGGYQFLDVEDFDVDGDGWGIGGSAALTDRFHLVASYSSLGLDLGIDATTLNAGVGVNFPMSSAVHLVAEAGYVRADFETPFGDVDDDGYFVSGGIRWMALEQLELAASVDYVDVGDFGDDTGLTVGALYSLTPNLAIGASVDLSDDATGYSAGLRYYLDR
jgi:hypothetical protein